MYLVRYADSRDNLFYELFGDPGTAEDYIKAAILKGINDKRIEVFECKTVDWRIEVQINMARVSDGKDEKIRQLEEELKMFGQVKRN